MTQTTSSNQPEIDKSSLVTAATNETGMLLFSLSVMLNNALDKICDSLALSTLSIIREFVYLKYLLNHYRKRPDIDIAHRPPLLRLWLAALLVPAYIFMGLAVLITAIAIPSLVAAITLFTAAVGLIFGIHALWKGLVKLRTAYREKDERRHAHLATFVLSTAGLLGSLLTITVIILKIFAISIFALTLSSTIIGVAIAAVALLFLAYRVISALTNKKSTLPAQNIVTPTLPPLKEENSKPEQSVGLNIAENIKSLLFNNQTNSADQEKIEQFSTFLKTSPKENILTLQLTNLANTIRSCGGDDATCKNTLKNMQTVLKQIEQDPTALQTIADSIEYQKVTQTIKAILHNAPKTNMVIFAQLNELKESLESLPHHNNASEILTKISLNLLSMNNGSIQQPTPTSTAASIEIIKKSPPPAPLEPLAREQDKTESEVHETLT